MECIHASINLVLLCISCNYYNSIYTCSVEYNNTILYTLMCHDNNMECFHVSILLLLFIIHVQYM